MNRWLVVLAALAVGGCTDEGSGDGEGADTGSEVDAGGDLLPPDGTGGMGEDETGSSGGFSISESGDEGESSSDGGEDPTGIGEGFEEVLVGELPGDPWLDVATRIAAPTVPSPTAMVVETEGAAGGTTRALQLSDAIGTSQGILTGIETSSRHRLAATVRVDQLTDATDGYAWPIAVALLQQDDADDLNDDPHVAVVAEAGGWHLRIVDGAGAVRDSVVPTPAIELGRWYRVTLEVDVEGGEFRATISDPGGGLLGEHAVLPIGWDEADGQYDAIGFFDGEYGVVGGTQGGRATVDDIEYEPFFSG